VTDTFFDLVRLKKDATGKAQADEVIKMLEVAGFPLDYIRTNLLMVGCDGASVNTGSRQGIAAQLAAQLNRPVLVSVCRAHILQLAVKDTNNTQKAALDQLQALYRDLCSFFKSSKQFDALVELSEFIELGHVYRMQDIFTIRWSASTKSQLVALWKNLRVIYLYLRQLEQSIAVVSVRQKAQTILMSITSKHFIHNLAGLIDALSVCGDVSEQLQDRCFPIDQLQPLVDLAIATFDGLYAKESTYLRCFTGRPDNEVCGGYPLIDNPQIYQIDFLEYYRSLSQALKTRMNTPGCVELFGLIEKLSPGSICARARGLSLLAPGDVENYRQQRESFETENALNLTSICAALPSLCDSDEELASFQAAMYYVSINLKYDVDTWPNDLKRFWQRVCCIPVSTADVERSFSEANDVKDIRRTNLDPRSIRNALLIKRYSAGPPDTFDPRIFVEAWMEFKKGQTQPNLAVAVEAPTPLLEIQNTTDRLLIQLSIINTRKIQDKRKR